MMFLSFALHYITQVFSTVCQEQRYIKQCVITFQIEHGESDTQTWRILLVVFYETSSCDTRSRFHFYRYYLNSLLHDKLHFCLVPKYMEMVLTLMSCTLLTDFKVLISSFGFKCKVGSQSLRLLRTGQRNTDNTDDTDRSFTFPSYPCYPCSFDQRPLAVGGGRFDENLNPKLE